MKECKMLLSAVAAVPALASSVSAGQTFGRPALADPQAQFTSAFGSGPFLAVANYRSNVIIDWTSPRTALLTAAESEGIASVGKYSEGIGHAAVFFRNSSGGDVLGFGQTGEDSGQGLKLLEKGLGFTAITNIAFTDGSLQDFAFLNNKAQLAMETRDAEGHNATKFAWIAFGLSQEQADDVDDFLTQYINASAYKNYGFVVDPLKLQGGGCTSFTNALVTKANVSFPLKDKWDRIVPIQAELMGFSQKAIDSVANATYIGPTMPNRTVPLVSPLAHTTWAPDNDTSATRFTFYDPELFYLTSSLARNHLLQATGQTPLPIYDRIPNDTFADAVDATAKQWVESYADRVSLQSLFDIPGVYFQ